eukprot:6177288-Pleurochrysis_carterae.AAC.1
MHAPRGNGDNRRIICTVLYLPCEHKCHRTVVICTLHVAMRVYRRFIKSKDNCLCSASYREGDVSTTKFTSSLECAEKVSGTTSQRARAVLIDPLARARQQECSAAQRCSGLGRGQADV